MTLTFEQQEERAEVLAEVQRLKAEASRMVICCNLIFDTYIKDHMWGGVTCKQNMKIVHMQ